MTQVKDKPENTSDTAGGGNDPDWKAMAQAGKMKIVTLSLGLIMRDLADEENDFDPVEVALNAIDVCNAEVGALKRQLSAHKGVATRAKNELEAVEAELPPRPRKFGAADQAADEIGASALLEKIAKADDVELTFVDATGTEILGPVPRTIQAAAFRADKFDRLTLTVPKLLVLGPQQGEAPYRIAGYVLVTDGKMLVQSRRQDGPLIIGVGSHFDLAGDVVF